MYSVTNKQPQIHKQNRNINQTNGENVSLNGLNWPYIHLGWMSLIRIVHNSHVSSCTRMNSSVQVKPGYLIKIMAYATLQGQESLYKRSKQSTKQNQIPFACVCRSAPLFFKKHEKELTTTIFEILHVLRVFETFFIDCQIIQQLSRPVTPGQKVMIMIIKNGK